MKVTQDEVADRQTVLHIELEDKDLGPYLERGYRRVVGKASIPGFRKGKAPRSVIEQYFGRETLISESIDFMLPDVTQKAVQEQGLDTVGLPKVEIVDLDPVSINATVAFPPAVNLGSYKDIRIEEETVDITNDDVNESLDALVEKSASWGPVERQVAMDDMVTMSIVGAVSDREIANQNDVTYVVDAENNMPFPGFAEKLVGIDIGSPKEFHLLIPDDYADTDLAGKEAHFTVSVSEIKEKVLPQVDDEFAKGVGEGYGSLVELREHLENDLKLEAENAQETRYKEAVLEALLNVGSFEIPPLLIERAVEQMVARRDEFVERLNIQKEDYLRYTGKSEEEIRTEMEQNAVDQLSRSWGLSTIAEAEKLEVSGDEVDERVSKIISDGGEQAEYLKGADLNSEEIVSSISDTLRVEKALERLIVIAKGSDTEKTKVVQDKIDKPGRKK